MTTPRDLLIAAMDMASSRPLGQGDLSLALAGAELIDLLSAQAISLDGDRIVPGYRPAIADHLLDEAASSLVQHMPYESVDDWLWRRGRGLSTAYLAALEAEGQLVRQRRRGWMPFRAGELVPAETPARREAANRWLADEPVLAALAVAIGIRDEQTGDDGAGVTDDVGATDDAGVTDDAVATVLAVLNDALSRLAFERQRRAIDEEAFSNIWRGSGD
ncbi:GPP34 family phosphoprotein [Streptomyces chattanoogensis]|uniref:GOLPH3/VPS74 family protein n=1 Tax=Streptomyces chattanoogensis TaxID=66876 RepID=UPI0036C0EA23